MSTTVTPDKKTPVDRLHSQERNVVSDPAPAAEAGESKSGRGKVTLVVCGALMLVAAAVSVYLLKDSSGGDTANPDVDQIQAAAEQKARERAAELAKSDAKLRKDIKQRGLKDVAKQLVAQRDAKFRTDIVGTWELPKEGKYHLTLNADNTGKLHYWPDRTNFVALAFTKKLEIRIAWSVKNGHVDMDSISGTPERAFTIATKARGKRKYYEIRSLKADELVLHELKTGKVNHWKKVE